MLYISSHATWNAPSAYKIVNLLAKRTYVGSSKSPRKRYHTHIMQLRTGRHGNSRLQKDFNTHGETSFVFQVLEHASPEHLLTLEQHYHDVLNPHYNLSPDVTKSTLGTTRSAETRAKHAASMLAGFAEGRLVRRIGRKFSEETKRRLSIAHKGRVTTEEAKAKTRATRTKRTAEGYNYSGGAGPQTKEAKQKIADSKRRFRVLTKDDKELVLTEQQALELLCVNSAKLSNAMSKKMLISGYSVRIGEKILQQYRK